MKTRINSRKIRQMRIRKKIFGSSERPRLCIFKSSKHLYAQVIDDSKGMTIASASDIKIREGKKKEIAKKIGEEIAKKCKEKKIKEVVFDRAGYKYTGIILEFCEAARKKGLKF